MCCLGLLFRVISDLIPGSRGLEPPAESGIISCCSYSLLTAYSVFRPSGFFAREAELAFAKQRLASESSLLKAASLPGMISPASLPRASEPHFPTKSASPPAEGSLASTDAPQCIVSADVLRRLAYQSFSGQWLFQAFSRSLLLFTKLV